MILKDSHLNEMITNPEKAAVIANLVYLNDDVTNFSIQRKRVEKDFIYEKNGVLIDQEEIERIESLVIPPAWEKVRITHITNGHLQVVGRDLKHRKQYKYHPLWSKIRNQTKFFKMASFANILPKIRQQVEKDLSVTGMPKRKVLALVIKLMEETHIRVGNEYYAKRNKTYGLSTLRSRHVTHGKGKLKFHFVGKKGKEHTVTLRNKKLIRLVNRCEEIPGWELFKYYDEANKKHTIDSGMINDYIQSISGDLFSAKDFRTWAATVVFFEAVRDIGFVEDKAKNQKNVLAGFDAAAAALGNTRNVCRKYYVHPEIVASYKNGSIVPYFEAVNEEPQKHSNFMSQTELIIRDAIKKFKIEV
ncbi:DNA topoisomerase IB [Aquimarina sp. W85]|uniref:DNA topoisomerase IB n=1 Tax=Aquimarina rhodophyticola TaxID=3342246 RepID=UPI003670D5EB